MASDQDHMGFSLRWQIYFLLGVTLLVSLVCMGLLAFWESSSVVIDVALARLLGETNAVAGRIEDVLKHARADALKVPNFPPPQGLIRTWDNEGKDPDQPGSTTQFWLIRLEMILASMIQAEPGYKSCSFLNEQGREVMRIESQDGRPVRVADQELLDLGNQDFFRETYKLDAGYVY